MEETLEIVSEQSPPFKRIVFFACGCVYTLDLPKACGKATPSHRLCSRHKAFRWLWVKEGSTMKRIPKGVVA
jgi:hypothetical protein